MKYLPTIDVWNPAMGSAIRNGQLKLQSGQWIQCGPGPKSRFVRISAGGSIWACHDQGAPGSATRRYREVIGTWRQVVADEAARRRARTLERERAPLFLELCA